jgi:hypothetical protein
VNKLDWNILIGITIAFGLIRWEKMKSKFFLKEVLILWALVSLLDVVSRYLTKIYSFSLYDYLPMNAEIWLGYSNLFIYLLSLHQSMAEQSMKGFFIVIFLMVFIISTASVDSKSMVISEEKAGGFQYKFTVENHKFTWEIGNNNSQSVIEENKDNEKKLKRFKKADNDAKQQQFVLIIYSVYLLIILIIMLIAFKKIKQKEKYFRHYFIIFFYATYKCLIVTLICKMTR